MTTEPIITTERIDDFPLLLAVMLQLGLPGIFDHHIKRHGLHQGLSWGWIASIWLAHLLTKSNHRKQPVQAWVKQAHATIEKITGQTVRDLDFTDDRLTLLLRRLSQPQVWQAIEKELSQNIIRVYDLKTKQCDDGFGVPYRRRREPVSIRLQQRRPNLTASQGDGSRA